MRIVHKLNAKTLVIFFAFAILLSWFTIYTTNSNSDTITQIDPYFPEELEEYVEIIGDTISEESSLKEKSKLNSIDSHVFYYAQGQYNFVINFNSDVTSSEIDRFMAEFYNSIIVSIPNSAESNLYYKEMIEIKDKSTTSEPLEKLSLRVYIDNMRAYRYDYVFEIDKSKTNPESISFYENVHGFYPFMKLDNDYVKSFIKRNEDLRKSITVRKSFKDTGMVIINIRSDKEYSTRYINKMKKKIERDLAPKLETEVLSNWTKESNYIGIVVQFQQNNSIYEESTYFFGFDAADKWGHEEWMNY